MISAVKRQKHVPPGQAGFDFGDPSEHYHALHTTPHGAVIVWEQDGATWHKIQPDQAPAEIATFLRGLSGQPNTFFTVNEFDGWRLQRLLKSLRAVFVDVDLHQPATRHDLDEALDVLREKLLPSPNLVVFSGRGMHFYWITTPTPASALPVWQAMERVLIDALGDLGADRKARDCTRVLRLAGTINSKTGAEVRGVVLDGTPWTFHGLCNEVLGYRPGKPGAAVRSIEAAKIKKGDHPKATIYRRWHRVLADLHQIGQHWEAIPEGYRNEFLFLGSVALSWFAAPDSIGEEVVDLAKLYCPGIGADEAARAATQSITRAKKAAGGETGWFGGQVCDPRYRFRRSTLWERLEELASPIKGKLRAIVPDELAEERQANRDRVAEGRYSDKYTLNGVRAGNEQKRATARIMAAAGRTQRAIAGELQVAVSTINAWIKDVR